MKRLRVEHRELRAVAQPCKISVYDIHSGGPLGLDYSWGWMLPKKNFCGEL